MSNTVSFAGMWITATGLISSMMRPSVSRNQAIDRAVIDIADIKLARIVLAKGRYAIARGHQLRRVPASRAALISRPEDSAAIIRKHILADQIRKHCPAINIATRDGTASVIMRIFDYRKRQPCFGSLIEQDSSFIEVPAVRSEEHTSELQSHV